MFENLKKEIAYAKTSLSARDLLYKTHGRITMARELDAITVGEYLELNHDCVAKGINNPKCF